MSFESGRQALECGAFTDFGTKNPNADSAGRLYVHPLLVDWYLTFGRGQTPDFLSGPRCAAIRISADGKIAYEDEESFNPAFRAEWPS